MKWPMISVRNGGKVISPRNYSIFAWLHLAWSLYQSIIKNKAIYYFWKCVIKLWWKNYYFTIVKEREIVKSIVHVNFWKVIVWMASIKLSYFISAIPVHFIHTTIKISKYSFVFIIFTFIFLMSLQSFKKTPSNQ